MEFEDIIIQHIHLKDVRFHTSRTKLGSDSRSTDPDYSCIYIELICNCPLVGVGTVFTLGRGNSAVMAVLQEQKRHIIGKYLKDITGIHFNSVWKQLITDGQLCWNGPEKGVCHQANAGLVNAIWDLWAKSYQKPIWQFVSELSAEELHATLNFDYVEDELSSQKGFEMLQSTNSNDRALRSHHLCRNGFPAYITCGWSGYSDHTLRAVLGKAYQSGIRGFKMKVGQPDDQKRAEFIRSCIGPECMLAMDASGGWSTTDAKHHMQTLVMHNPAWIEEPTHPDDICGHAELKKHLITPIATGEQCPNKIMVKQFLQASAIDIFQTDIQRLAGINEWLVVMLMCKQRDIPVCMHSGGIGLTNLNAHLCMIDYICVTGSDIGRYTEFVDDLHEYFVNPVQLVNGRYMPPTAHGFGIEFTLKTLETYTYPHGKYWRENSDIILQKGWSYYTYKNIDEVLLKQNCCHPKISRESDGDFHKSGWDYVCTVCNTYVSRSLYNSQS